MPAGLEVTLPGVFPAVDTVSWKVCEKLAMVVAGWVMTLVIVQVLAVPLQPPDQLTKVLAPEAAAALSATVEPWVTVVVQVPLDTPLVTVQLSAEPITTPDETPAVTVPDPAPATDPCPCTTTLKVVLKVAVV